MMIRKIWKILRSVIYSIIYSNKLTSKRIHCLGKLRLSGNRIKNGTGVVFYDGVKIVNNGTLTIGDNVKIGDNVIIYCNNSIHIGANTIIAANSYIIDCNHNIDRAELIMKQPLDNGSVFIGEDCWLGEDVSILKDAYIGKGSVIGAKTLVNKRIDEYKVAVGCPAKVIKERI